ncbi:hypothetical protein PVOR_12320 [Paenibacillus vortex V453]|uniref:YtkA-like domain-containing protein n=2 Tax=Paenibacillus TaxID=44249 RepID=A0A2R9SWG2_9BACL|nr:hypothetical protein PVOR_12320 [Paenibacillus vortex V453]
MKKSGLIVLILCVLLLVSCSSAPASDAEVEELIRVDLILPTGPVKTSETVPFEARVTQGESPVEDAQEVEFEFRLADQVEFQRIEAKHEEDGRYRIEKAFEVEGTYEVTAHVTARGMHVMPKKEIVVGDLWRSELR